MLVIVYAAREFDQTNQSKEAITWANFTAHLLFFSFVLTEISHSYQLDQSISVIIFDGWYFSFLLKF